MPKPKINILDYITDGVQQSKKYWEDMVSTYRTPAAITSELRLPMNSAQRAASKKLTYAESQLKYFKDPRLSRPDFEKLIPLKQFQQLLPKNQIGDPFEVISILKNSDNVYLQSVGKEVNQFYPIGKQLQLQPIDIKEQMGLRLRDLLNNIYRKPGDPMIFRQGGNINNLIDKHRNSIYSNKTFNLKTTEPINLAINFPKKP